MSASLYERLGGDAAIAATVDRFYGRVLQDPDVGHYFAGLDMETQVRKQIGFMAWAFGGPSEFKDRDLATAHRHLVRQHGLNDHHFDRVAAHLRGALEELSVEEALIAEVLALVATTRDQVLGRET